MTSKTRELTGQISAGFLIWNFLLAAGGWILAPVFGWMRSSVLLGVLMGAVLGELMLIHMAAVTEKVLKSEDQVSAEKTAAFHSVLRKLIFFGIIALILWKVPQVNALGTVLGVMGLKAGAYLQPVLFRSIQEDVPVTRLVGFRQRPCPDRDGSL